MIARIAFYLCRPLLARIFAAEAQRGLNESEAVLSYLDLTDPANE